MKYLPCGPIEELGSGGGDDIFIYSWRRQNKGSHSISSLGTGSSGKAGFVSVSVPLAALWRSSAQALKASKQFQLLAV